MMDAALGTDLAAGGEDEDEEAYVVARAARIGRAGALVAECGPVDSSGECGGLVGHCAHVAVVSVWRSDVGRGVAANAQMYRSLRDTCRSRGRQLSVVAAVHDDEAAPWVGEEIEAMLTQAIAADIASACAGDLSWTSSVEAISVDADATRLAQAVEDRCLGAADVCDSAEAAASLMAASWDESRATVSIEDVSDFVCDSAASRARDSAQAAFGRWRRDVDDGRLAPRGWATECADLVRDLLQRYSDETVGYWTYPGRSARRSALETFLVDEVKRCHLKQLETASSRRLRRLRASLERTAAHHPNGDLDPNDAAKLVADAETAFDLDAARCEVPPLGLLATDQRAAFRDAAQRLATNFAETPAAQLLATKAEQRRARAATKRADQTVSKQRPRKPPSLSYALQLVGMLRPRGYGNLQGFCNYAIGPHSILFGYSDDRDVAGDMSVSDDIPLLRFQPKLTLDLDL